MIDIGWKVIYEDAVPVDRYASWLIYQLSSQLLAMG